jgi:hypothetical protein
MHTGVLVSFLSYAEPVACLAALIFMARRHLIGELKYVAGYLASRVILFAAWFSMQAMVNYGFKPAQVYPVYFYVYWGGYLLEAILGFGIILSIYKLAMAPLPGLQRLGMIMFRWAAGISAALALSVAFAPHVTGIGFIIRAVSQLQQSQSVLTLCMLLFVCMAVKPMGLSHRSKTFLISLGLGVMATADLVGAAWLSQAGSLASIYNIVNGLAILVTLAIWTVAFAVPEPRRSMIILPTTSPFLRWNQISMALGDAPGFVVVGEVTTDIFAPAEVEIMRRASRKMDEPSLLLEKHAFSM